MNTSELNLRLTITGDLRRDILTAIALRYPYSYREIEDIFERTGSLDMIFSVVQYATVHGISIYQAINELVPVVV